MASPQRSGRPWRSFPQRSGIFHRAKICVEVEGLAERDVYAGRAACNGRAHRALQGYVVATDGFYGSLIDQLAGFGGFVGAGFGVSRELRIKPIFFFE